MYITNNLKIDTMYLSMEVVKRLTSHIVTENAVMNESASSRSIGATLAEKYINQ